MVEWQKGFPNQEKTVLQFLCVVDYSKFIPHPATADLLYMAGHSQTSRVPLQFVEMFRAK